jgi:hypothetical protein
MHAPRVCGAVVVIGTTLMGHGPQAQASDVSVGDGIVVVDLTAADCHMVLEAVDSAAAFAAIVSPALPAQYHAAVRLAAGGWAALRLVIPDGVSLRAVLTLLPPALLVFPQAGTPASEVIRVYRRIQDQTVGRARAAVKEIAGTTGETLEAARKELAARMSCAMLSAAIWERGAADHHHRRASSFASLTGAEPLTVTRGRLDANREVGGEWERFVVMAHPDGTISLRARTGFLCAEAGGGGTAICNRAEPRAWERWTVVKNPDGTLGLRANQGQFLSVSETGSVTVDRKGCNETGTKFLLECTDGAVYLKTAAGKYISAQP